MFDPKLGMSKYTLGLFDLVVKDYNIAIFEHKMNLPHLLVYAFENDQKKHEEGLRKKRGCR